MVTIEDYIREGFSEAQANEILCGLEEGIDVSVYMSMRYNSDQMMVLRWGLEKAVNVSIYANPEYNDEQMFEIYKGLEEGLDVTVYADTGYSAEQMQKIRQELEKNIHISLNQEKSKKRLFVDMDGTLAEFKQIDTLEQLYEKGYFENLQPQMEVVNAVKKIIEENPDIEVNILSAVLSDSPYALQEKNDWLDRYLPEIDVAHRLFPPCGSDKKEIIHGGITQNDFLLDDYTVNLNAWEPPARGIKLLNGINHTRGTWQNAMVEGKQLSDTMAKEIVSIIRQSEKMRELENQNFPETDMARNTKRKGR